MKQIILLFIAVIAFVAFVGYYSQDLVKKTQEPGFITKKEIAVGDDKILAEVADEETERRTGLSGKDGLAENEGMLFVFPSKTSNASFWMKDMKFAIDIIWINDDKVVKIDKNVQPEPGVPDDKLRRYTPGAEVNYVLEIGSGETDKKDIKSGDTVLLTP